MNTTVRRLRRARERSFEPVLSGWAGYIKHQSLKNLKTTGESALAYAKAILAFPAELTKLIKSTSQAQWLMPIIPALREAKMDGSWSGVQGQPDQHGETPSLLKIQILARHGGMCLYSQLLRRLKHENCLNPGGRVAVS